MLIRLIRLYQVSTARMPGVCRFTPSCSEYAIQAITKHGSLKGAALAFWRICRCNPFTRGGYDPP